MTVASACSIEDHRIVYGEQTNEDNVEIDRYQCRGCGHILHDADGVLIVDQEYIVEVIEEGTFMCLPVTSDE